MTATEILNEIDKLPMPERQKLVDSLSKINADNDDSIAVQLQKSLFDEGLLREVRTSKTNKTAEFKPLKIKGEPVSETIIRERR